MLILVCLSLKSNQNCPSSASIACVTNLEMKVLLAGNACVLKGNITKLLNHNCGSSFGVMEIQNVHDRRNVITFLLVVLNYTKEDKNAFFTFSNYEVVL